ncbi:MAG: hypothetical protein C4548_13300, partial [Desulfobacteraceae bacterium]
LFPYISGLWFMMISAGLVILAGFAVVLLIDNAALIGAACYLLFIGLSGSIFVGVFMLVTPDIGWPAMPYLAGAYVLAWLAGFLTPGAPAGLGVRELVLASLLAGLASIPSILFTVLMSRAITAIGDLLFFVAGQALPATEDLYAGDTDQ